MEYIEDNRTAREIKIVFDPEPRLDGYTCERLSIEWYWDHYKTSVYVLNENILLERIHHWDELCPDKALAYVFTNIE